MLNLLSQEGIYVDELPMDPVDPVAWRRFMSGVRGPEIAAVGGIRDPQALDTARRLTASDSIFRDSALFFQRRFDGVLAEFAGRQGCRADRARRHPIRPRLHAARPAEPLARVSRRRSRRASAGRQRDRLNDTGRPSRRLRRSGALEGSWADDRKDRDRENQYATRSHEFFVVIWTRSAYLHTGSRPCEAPHSSLTHDRTRSHAATVQNPCTEGGIQTCSVARWQPGLTRAKPNDPAGAAGRGADRRRGTDAARPLHGTLPRASRARLLRHARSVRRGRRLRHRARGQPDVRRARRRLGGAGLGRPGARRSRSCWPSSARGAAR